MAAFAIEHARLEALKEYWRELIRNLERVKRAMRKVKKRRKYKQQQPGNVEALYGLLGGDIALPEHGGTSEFDPNTLNQGSSPITGERGGGGGG